MRASEADAVDDDLPNQDHQATAAIISPGVGVVAATNGVVQVRPAATTTYTLTATNAAGSSSAVALVGVDVTLAPPMIIKQT